jgi:transposase-like protein
LVEDHLAGTGPIKVFAKELDDLSVDAEGRVLCPTCRSAMSREVLGGSGWTEGFARAFACQHCGQRFGITT